MKALILSLCFWTLAWGQGGGGLFDGLRQFGFDLPNPQQQQQQGGGGGGWGRGGGGDGGRGGPGYNLGGILNCMTQQFFPPAPHNIPPHVFRRIMRFCTRHPDHPRCQGHPEWVMAGGRRGLPPLPVVGGGGLDLGAMFPELANFKLPPIPNLNLPDVLKNVPSVLKNFIPAPILGQITEIARNAIRVS